MAFVACGDDGTTNGDQVAGKGGATAAAGSGGTKGGGEASQTPPQGADALEAWISDGSYKTWHCEDKVHASRSPSPHGFNRICSNDLISNHATDDGAWAKGAAAVKEMYTDENATKPAGYAVYLKTESDSADGANWYWYERLPLDSDVPHDSKGVVADGMGDSGPANTICVGCHAAAGSDKAHTPSTGGRDQVYTPVH